MRYKSVKKFIYTVAVAACVCSFAIKSGFLSTDTSNQVETIVNNVTDTVSTLDLTEKEDYDTALDTVESAKEELNAIDGIEFEEATLVRVVDGDTIVVNIHGEEAKVRMIGVDTPESVASQEYLDRTGKENTEEGYTASDYTKTLLENVETVYLQKDTSDTDRYGRLLRYVWLDIPDEITTQTIAENMVNGILLADKIAKPVEYKPDTKYANEFQTIYDDFGR